MSGGIDGRKADHLRIAMHDAVEAPLHGAGAFDGVRLVHQALPELDLDAIDPSMTLLGRRLALPLLIGSMTGGTDEAAAINRRLATAAQRCGVGMCLGSQRIMLEQPETARTFQVRQEAPDVLLIANLGAVQLNLGVGPDDVDALAAAVGADALVLHLNAAQEAVQEGGDTCFAGLTERLATVLAAVSVPCGLKEVGGGFSVAAARHAASLPISFLESAGRGGTSWTLIEGRRAATEPARRLGALFADWGVPSVTSLLACVQHGPPVPIIASGGLRNGLDAARALALGASACAMALPLLRAAADSVDAVVAEIEAFGAALRTAMFLVGARDLEALRAVPVAIDPALRPEIYEGAAPFPSRPHSPGGTSS